MTNLTCQKWFVKFLAGDFSLNNALPSGRPGKIHNDQIKTSTENNQRYPTRE